MRRQSSSTIFLLGVCLVFLVSGCASLSSLIGQHYETFTFEINNEQVDVRLPEELPSMEKAKGGGEQCFNLLVCVQSFCLSEEKDHDHIDFLYRNGKVIALVWTKTTETEPSKRYVSWIYAEGIPILVDIKAINELINDPPEKKPKETSLLSLTEFTWEGELNPNEFDDWKLLSVRPVPQGYFWVFIENPDQTSAIDVVVLEVDLNSNVLGYRYFKDGEPYLYVFDVNKGKYVHYSFTQEEKESCMKCHSDKPERDLLHEDMRGAYRTLPKWRRIVELG